MRAQHGRAGRKSGPVLGSGYLSSVRLMWMLVLFDLPVLTKRDRKAATDFRKYLMNRGFSMAQYSVYYRLLSGKEAIESLLRALKKEIPPRGKVDILAITDRQYEEIQSFSGGKQEQSRKNPPQLQLF